MSNRPNSSVSRSVSSFNDATSQENLQSEEKKPSIFMRIINTFWGTKQLVDKEGDQDVLIKTTLKELILYCIYLVIICIITFGMANPINFYYTNIMMNLFLNAETEGGTSFSGMASMQDFWDVMQGPTMDSLYWEEWYNGQNSSFTNFIYYENKLLGVPRLRQVRVSKNSCRVPTLFKTTISDCYDSYNFFNEDKSPFGLYATDQSNMNETAFFYQSSSKVNAPVVGGTVGTYGGGGYVKVLHLSKNASADALQFLVDNVWLDRGTRAVFLDFSVYNANINLFCQIRLISEFPSTGGVLPSFQFRTVKLLRYVSSMDYFVLACEIIFVLFTIYYSIEEILEVKTIGMKYFKEVWNCLDIVMLIICYICIIFNIYRIVKVDEILDSLLENYDQYPEFDSLAAYQQQFNSAIAITAFISWIRIFKFISFNKTMNQLNSTLGRCAKDVLGFMIMFGIVFMAYAQLGYLLFGGQNPDYSSLTTTLFTLFRTVLGDFDFPTLQATSPTMGPIYFISYIFFVFFVLMNMFLAIINDTYSEVKGDCEEDEFDLGGFFKRGVDKMLTKAGLAKAKIVDIQNILDAEQDENETLDFDKWRAELRSRGYADAEIEAYFAKYDKDGDRNLTAEERRAMRDDLNKESEEIDEEMERIKAEQEEAEEAEKNANLIQPEEFKILTRRVDSMETSIGQIVGRIDNVLTKLDQVEKAKLKRRENMAMILEKLNEANSTHNELKRAQLHKMVKEELENWDEPLESSTTNLNSRAASSLPVPSSSAGKNKQSWPQF
jgi:polycystin 2